MKSCIYVHETIPQCVLSCKENTFSIYYIRIILIKMIGNKKVRSQNSGIRSGFRIFCGIACINTIIQGIGSLGKSTTGQWAALHRHTLLGDHAKQSIVGIHS